jgi:hypothetical protein
MPAPFEGRAVLAGLPVGYAKEAAAGREMERTGALYGREWRVRVGYGGEDTPGETCGLAKMAASP